MSLTDECNSQVEDCKDDVFLPLHIDEQYPQFAGDPVMNIIVENNWASQQAELEISNYYKKISEQVMDPDMIIIIFLINCLLLSLAGSAPTSLPAP